MSASSGKTKYILDTNILIGFALWRPITLCKPFWDELAESLSKGDWVLVDVVVGEVKSTFDQELAKWVEAQKKKGLMRVITDENKERAVEINNTYEMIDEVSQKSTVDTYIIAFSEENGFGIFSQESPRRMQTDLYKIPDVCDKLNIKRIRKPVAFLSEVGIN